jgi:hypothetical protein
MSVVRLTYEKAITNHRARLNAEYQEVICVKL